MMSHSSASILARLKNKAKEEGIAFQQLLNLFFQEEFIRRLAQSDYKEKLILKGGFLLYSISGFTTRPTVDADYLLKNYSNELDSVDKLVRSILEKKSQNEFMEIEIRSIEPISEMKEYNGIRVNLIGYMGKTKTPFSIDFGVGDTIVPSALTRTLPVLLDGFEKPTILTYSLESTISEKFDAIIRFMESTGRMKDFYDIYYLATSFEFEGRKIQEAIYETLSKRRTPYEKDTVQVIERLITNDAINSRWNIFCKKVLKYELSLNEVVRLIISFLDPPFQAIIEEDELTKNWSSKKGNMNEKRKCTLLPAFAISVRVIGCVSNAEKLKMLECQLWSGERSSEEGTAPASSNPGRECWPEESTLRAAVLRRSRRGRR